MKQAAAWTARLDADQHKGLQEIADACRVEKVTALRWATDALIAYWKKHNARVLLPLNFDETFRVSSKNVPILDEPVRRASPVSSAKLRMKGRAN